MEKFDVAVVGAGPAGSAAARACALKGFSTLLVERANRPGQKNVFGGRIYAYPLEAWYPGWRKDCPVERFVVRESLVFTSGEDSVSIDYEAPRMADAREASFTAYRLKFDEWLARKAEEAGAMLITGIRVDDVWREGHAVKGIAAGGDKVRADVVIAADGAVSQLARRAGLGPEAEPGAFSVGVKETIELPPAVIEERFNLQPGRGASMVFAGAAGGGLRGGGFLYTNQASVSLGLVVSSEDLGRRHVQVADLLERFKALPAVAKYLRGGKTAEYSAHLIPELGAGMNVRWRAAGMLVAGDAGGFLINNGYTFRGVDLAIASGVAAAEAVAQARAAGGYSESNLAAYDDLLRKYSISTDLETFARAAAFMKNPRLFSVYPDLVVGLAGRMYTVDGRPKGRIFDLALAEARARKLPLFQVLRDLLGGARAM